MPLMSGGDAVVRSLLAHEISTIYCLPGVQSDHLFNAMFDAVDALSVVHTRHEQGAALRRSAPHPRPASPIMGARSARPVSIRRPVAPATLRTVALPA